MISVVAKCSSCVNRENCDESLKDATTCRRYHTRVLLMWDGKNVQFHCPTNNKFSDWYKREALSENVELLDEIATKLDVRPKDVWALLLEDDIPQKRPMTPAPEFDVEEKGFDKQRARGVLCDWLIENYTFLTLVDSQEVLVYKEGVYEKHGEKIIVEALQAAFGNRCTTHDANELLHLVQRKTLMERAVFQECNPPKICLQNGILNLDTGEFTDHSETEYFLSKVPVTYDLEADCPIIDRFFHEIVPEENVQTLYDFIGYILFPGLPLHKALVLVGGQRAGKTTFERLLEKFLGEENCSDVSLQELTENRFARARLIGKMANVFDDLPYKDVQNTGILKMIVGGKRISAEIKHVQEALELRSGIKMVWTANTLSLPRYDDSLAWYRRWIIIVCPNCFEIKPKEGQKKADLKLIDKLTTPKELSGLLNRAVKGLNELLERGYFEPYETDEKIRERYIKSSGPIGKFYLENLEETVQDVYIEKGVLYSTFIKYCHDNGLPSCTTEVFSRKLKQYFSEGLAKDSTTRILHQKVRVWRHLKYQEPIEPEKGDLDTYTVLSDKTNIVIKLIVELQRETGMVEKQYLIKQLEETYSINDINTQQIISNLLREGIIFSPKEGYIKKT